MKDLVADGFTHVVKPYIDREDNKSRGIIAPVEKSPAEAAHAVGDQIIYNGVIYDVTAAISIGDALATTGVGANIEETDLIVEQIKKATPTIDANVTKNSTNAVQSGGVYTKTKAIEETIAPVEENAASASQAYTVGKHLILNDVLYKVTAAITAGDALATTGAGANIEAENDVETQIRTINTALATKQNATDNTLQTTSKTVPGAINEINTALGGKADSTTVNNKHKVTSFEVSITGWTQDTTSQSGTTLQKKQISLQHVYVESPSIEIGAASGSVLPTTAQQTAYNLLQYVTVDSEVPCLYLYASDVPTDAFYINVEGVE